MSAVLPTAGTTDENVGESSLKVVDLKEKQIENTEQPPNIDVSELASLLQCLGFTVENFAKNLEAENQPTSLPESIEGYLQVEITCNKSHMKATLLKEKGPCKCPSKEDASNAQFWNISACSPSLPGNVTISKCSLIPTISADRSKLINTLLMKALDIVNSNDGRKRAASFTEFSKTSESIPQYRSLENLKSESSIASAPKITLEPKISENQSSSPAHTSSPIPDLSNGIKPDCERTIKLLDTMKEAHKMLSAAIEMASSQNITFTKRVRRISDIKISPLAVEDEKGLNSSRLHSTRSNSTCSSSFRTPRKSKTPKKTPAVLGEKRKFLVPPSKFGLLKLKKSDTGTPAASKSLSGKKDVSKLVNNGDKKPKSNVSTLKAKSTAKNDSVSKLRIPSKIASLTSVRTPKK